MNDTSFLSACAEETLVFREPGLSDISLLNKYFETYGSRSCDLSVGGVLMWSEWYSYRICEVDGTLLIKGYDPRLRTHVFYEPCGPLPVSAWLSIIEDYSRMHHLDRWIAVCAEEENLAYTDRLTGSLPTQTGTVTEWKEYLYPIERFISFAGKKMEKKRNHLHYFINNYSPYTIEEITPERKTELLAFCMKFGLAHADGELASYESQQVAEVLRNYDSYPFYGVLLRKDEEILGFSFGELIGDTFIIHAEKGDVRYRGVYQALSSALAAGVREKFSGVRYLNREDDMGNDNLRKSKESYHPAMFIHKRIIASGGTAR